MKRTDEADGRTARGSAADASQAAGSAASGNVASVASVRSVNAVSAITRMLADAMLAGERILFVGVPGCGKTARGTLAAAVAGFQLARDAAGVRAPWRMSMLDRLDLGGALYLDGAAGVTRQLPLEPLRALRTETAPTLLFLDDLGQMPLDAQAPTMSLFDAGALPDNVVIWGATNRLKDKAGVVGVISPLWSRFDSTYTIATPANPTDGADGAQLLAPWSDERGGTGELQSWLAWFAGSGLYAAEIAAWHRSTNGRTLHTFESTPTNDFAVRVADFRSWHTAAKKWQRGVRDLHSYSATLGKGVASEFLGFAATASQLAAYESVVMDPNGAKVPSEEQPAALYLQASMVAARCELRHAGAVLTYAARLPEVFAALLVKDVFNRLGAAVAGEPAFVRWYSEHEELVNVG